MTNFKKFLGLILSLILITCCFTGCKDSKEEYIYFELLEAPRTLDPQIAQSDSELLIVRNIYEGLLRKDSSGKIVNGVITDYSYNNLTYTFKLKEKLTWSDGTQLTADDFVYGLRRAVDKKINAPFASRLKNIKGAEDILNGIALPDSLGVKAVDKNTLQITMAREDKSFTDTLTTSVCMPCNEEFFENSIGKYGLDAENIISNGSYRLSKWNKEDFGIRLYKNEEYSGKFEAQNAAVFISCINDEAQAARLKDGDSDMAFLPCSELDKIDSSLKITKVNNICWVLTVKGEYSSNVRKAFANAFSTDIYASSLPSGFTATNTIYPEILGVSANGAGITEYNLEAAKGIMSNEIAEMPDKKFPQAMLYYYNVDGVSHFATDIVGHWQQNLGTFVNIKAADNLTVLQNEVKTTTLDFALFPITANGNIFSEYAANFDCFSKAQEPTTLQQEVLKNNTLIPVAQQSTNIAYIKTLENVVMEESNGYIDFSFIIKR